MYMSSKPPASRAWSSTGFSSAAPNRPSVEATTAWREVTHSVTKLTFAATA